MKSKKLKLLKNANGFSLLEMIIAVAIFSLVTVSVMSAYVSIFKAGRNAKIVQKNIENTRGAMDIMAKTIRSGEVDGSSAQDIKLFVYDAGSSTDGKCIKFSFASNSIQQKQTNSGKRDPAYPDCKTATYSNPAVDLVDISSGFTVTGKFAVTPVSDAAAGKVTILADVQSGTDSAKLQTSVTLSGSKEVAPN